MSDVVAYLSDETGRSVKILEVPGSALAGAIYRVFPTFRENVVIAAVNREFILEVANNPDVDESVAAGLLPEILAEADRAFGAITLDQFTPEEDQP